METNPAELPAAGSSDADISALPNRLREMGSIVDQLLDLPAVPDADAPGPHEWEAVMARRLQGRLAEAMRDLIEHPRAKHGG